jgi:hypothetical protein
MKSMVALLAILVVPAVVLAAPCGRTTIHPIPAPSGTNCGGDCKGWFVGCGDVWTKIALVRPTVGCKC